MRYVQLILREEREFHDEVGLTMQLTHLFSFGSLQLTTIYVTKLIGFMGLLYAF